MDRLEGLSKLAGLERYVGDLLVEGCWWGATVRSPSPRGRIRRIRFRPEVDWSDFAVVDARDIPGANCIRHIEDDQPALALDRVRHVHEPVLLVAHPSRSAVRRAVRAVEIEVDEDDPVLDFRSAPRPAGIQHGTDNVFSRITIEKGDLESAMAEAAYIVEGVYETGAQEHVCLETQGMLANVEDGVVVVRGSMQCPFYVKEAISHALAKSGDEVRVIQTPTGGGFGGKEDYPSMIGVHAALLAQRVGHPVRMIYDRREDMAATPKRHPSRIRHRTGVDANGRLVAQDVDILLDGGAYTTLSPVVVSRAAIHATGPYACTNARVRGRVVLTNSVPCGAFRGFGGPQAHFANERHMDVIAASLGMDPAELRRRNLLRDGDATLTGQIIEDGTDRVALMDRALEIASVPEKRSRHREFNRSHAYLRRGIGMAAVHHGCGFTGDGEDRLDSRVEVAGLADGAIEVRTASTEMGQGATTILTKLAADRLDFDPRRVRIAPPDTARVPDSGPTVASRTAMIVGKLVEDACDDLRRRLGVAPSCDGEALAEALRGWHLAHPRLLPIGEARYRRASAQGWDASRHRGDAYGAYSWATQVAEVEVDLRTGVARVVDFVSVQDVGRVLDRLLATGQVEGGVAQSLGWALLEQVRFDRGAMINPSLTEYAVPSCRDVPPIRVEFVESPYAGGGQGARGLGEIPADGPAPAIANAIADATGSRPDALPLTAERLAAVIELVPRGGLDGAGTPT